MHSNITRNERERCVMARIQRQGQRLQENFGLKKYGNWEDAERAAQDWVRSKLPNLPPIPSSKNRMTVRNHSGVVGVHFAPGERVLPSGNRAAYPVYVSRWPGSRGGVSWSLSTYNGPESAFVHAVICRRLETKNRDVVVEAVRNLSGIQRAKILELRNEEGA